MKSPKYITLSDSLVTMINQRCRENPHVPAFSFLADGEHISTQVDYAELFDRINAIAAGIQQRTKPGDRIVVMMPPSIDYICVALACFYAGTVLVPIYPLAPEQINKGLQMLKAVAIDAEARLLITCNQSFNISREFISHESMLNDLGIATAAELSACSRTWQDPKVTPESLALLMYTSGSTGQPKGVMLSHGNIIHNATIYTLGSRITHRDRICAWVPPYHISGLFAGIIVPVYLGCSQNITFSPQCFLENPLRWLGAIHHYGATVSGSPTFGYDLCIRAAANASVNFDLSHWHTAVVGGEAIRYETFNRFTERFSPHGFKADAIFSMYGLTESNMICTGNIDKKEPTRLQITRQSLQHGHIQIDRKDDASVLNLISSGKPLLDMMVKAVNVDNYAECPEGSIGEIWIAGPSIAQGYWNQCELTNATFKAQLANDKHKFFLRSGDLGFFHEGELYITGRLKEMIIIRGLNYYPEDIEKTVRTSHADLANIHCAAFAIEKNDCESLAIVFEHAKADKISIIEPIISAIRSRIAKFHGLQVDGFIACFPGEIPKTATQKIQRTACLKKILNKEWKFIEFQQAENSGQPDSLARLTAKQLSSYAENKQLVVLYNYLQQYITKVLAIVPNPSWTSLQDIPLSQLGLDSINVVKLIAEIKSITEITIPIAEFYGDITLLDLAEKVLQQKASAHLSVTKLNNTINIANEVNLLSSVSGQHILKKDLPNQTILLTGATGFLGGYLLHDLLEKTSLQVICFVRAKNNDDALDRIIKHSKSINKWKTEYQSRITAIASDLEQPYFGLDLDLYNSLAKKVDKVLHCAAAVNFVAPYEKLRAANVLPVIRLLEFATTETLKSLHYISTLGVFNAADRHLYPVILESDLVNDCNQIFGGYAQTKAVAEILCHEASQRNVPVSIYRPGLISGDSRTGFCNTDDFLCRLIKGCLQLGKFPILDLELDMSPVDYVSQAIVSLATDDSAQGQIYHVANPHPIPFEQFLNWIEDYGYKIKRLPLRVWQAEIEYVKEDNALYPLLPFLTERQTSKALTFFEVFTQGKNPLFDFAQISSRLNNTRVRCHPVNNELLDIYFNYFVKSRFLSTPIELEIEV